MRTKLLRGARLAAIVVPVGLAVACAGQPPVTPPIPPPAGSAPEPTTPRPQPAPCQPERIPGAPLEKAAAGVEPGTALGAAVYDRTTGRWPLEHNADRPFRSASLVKLLVAIDALRHGAGPADRERIVRMLARSDDGAASVLWVRRGGPELVTRTSAELGLHGVRPPEVPGWWGEVVLTPRDVVAIYRHVLRLPPVDRALVVGALARAPRYAADGFDQHFGIPDGLAGPWAVKQGWGNNDRAMVVHSTGLAGAGHRYVVVLLTEHPLGSGWRTSARSVTAAAAAMDGRLPGL